MDRERRERQEAPRLERQGRASSPAARAASACRWPRRWAKWARASRITARKQDELDEARAHLEAHRHRMPDASPATSPQFAAIPGIVDAVLARWGQIDILVNNAGCNWAAPAEDYPDDGWRKVMNLNVDAQFFLAREVGAALDDSAPQRQDRQHRVDRRPLRQSARLGDADDRLQHEQGRARQHDARARRRMGPPQHQRQRDLPGLLSVEDDQGHARPHRRAACSR